MKYNRGGKSLKVGDIGQFSVLRQNILMPGEMMRSSITGNVRLAGLRQQTSVYLHASIEAFAAPLRWYWDDFTDYITEGVSTIKTQPTLSGAWLTDLARTTNMGVGSIQNHAFLKFFAQHPINVWNEHYRWPEATKFSVDTPLITFFAEHGQPCVNLPTASSRIHDAPVFDDTEHLMPAVTQLDVRQLSLYQARLAQAAKTDWSSQERYNVFMRDVFNAQGSNEVDKVPIKLRKGAQLSVMPKDKYATDGPSLGELMSINNFQVSHAWEPFRAQEHMVVCYIMLLRFSPIIENEVMPGIHPEKTAYVVYQGDPNTIGASEPLPVSGTELQSFATDTVLGYLPAGWQLREGYNHVDRTIATLNNFPLMAQQPNTAAGYRDASLINQATFRSTALRHWFADLDFKINVDGRIPSAGMSIMTGSNQGGAGLKGNHPTGGYLE